MKECSNCLAKSRPLIGSNLKFIDNKSIENVNLKKRELNLNF